MTNQTHIPFIYNLFPPLVGEVGNWPGHVRRAAEMGFNWVFLNPIQLPGASGSLYSIRDHFTLNPAFFPESAPGSALEQLQWFVETCRAEMGVEVMVDLVINHTAYDNPLTRDHRDWYKHNDDGSIMSPGAVDDQAPGGYVTWGDLSEIDNEHSSDRNNLHEYWWEMVQMFLDAGVRGFRCDAAYQVPMDLWRMLIGRSKEKVPEAMFFAESLGCPLEDTLALAAAGHDFCFNSGKWWDYRSEWFPDQLNHCKGKVRTIGFPESHDTERIFTEWNGDMDRIKQHYIFTALASSGVLIPVGFEYGFRGKPHVVHTHPHDWEGAHCDLTDFIREVNAIKAAHRPFQEDNGLERVHVGHNDVLGIRKTTLDGSESALLLFNLTENDLELDLGACVGAQSGKPVSPAGPESEQPRTIRLGRKGVAAFGL